MNRYDSNETMRIIGHSCIQSKSLDRIDPIYAAFMDNIKPGQKVNVRELMIDAYALGVMDGKRSERQRRKGNAHVGKEM